MTYIKNLKFLSIIFLFIIALVFSNIIHAEDVKIALRANKGAAKGLIQWQATADHLSASIPGYHFIIVPFENNSALNQAISLGDFHFSITNPAAGVEQQIRYSTQPIATLVNKRQGKGYSQFGSVIFTRADRDDINTLQDTKGKMFIGVDELGFGGWRIAWNELLENGINPYTDYSELRFAGGKQQDVVYAVWDKKADAGVVRTDTLERMEAEGLIKLSNYKVLNAKKTKEFPFLHSTKLYPEWMFSAASKTDDKLKEQVTAILFSIDANSQAAINGKYVKWIAPLDYSSVNDLLKRLKVGPYNVATMDKYKRLLNQYGTVVSIGLFIIALLISIIIYVVRVNRQLLSTKDSLKYESELNNKLEKQLLYSQRAESLGQLTGGIAHDFNNMLASIVGFTELSLHSNAVKNDEKLTRYLNHVLVASEKSSALISQMQAFSKSAADNDKPVDIRVSQFLAEVKHLLDPIVPSGFKINVKEIDSDLMVHINVGMLTQVMMNLYLNARDAVTSKNGYMTISAKHINFNSPETFCDSCHTHISGDYIAIFVEDNGCGIDSEVKLFIFDPFFSTKEVGKGTGMGLSTVHGIVHKHNGHILVDSQESVGSVFKILLPAVTQFTDGKIPENKVLSRDLDSVAGKTNKQILVIDDEVSLTIYLKELLVQYDYTVITFNDENKALEYFTRHHQTIDLVITDQTMLSYTGVELSQKMFQISKDVPVILYSGDIVDIDNKMKSNTSIKAMIQKPLITSRLLEIIESLIISS